MCIRDRCNKIEATLSNVEVQNIMIKTGTASPHNTVAPGFIGETYIDTQNKTAWIACGAANTDLRQIAQ